MRKLLTLILFIPFVIWQCKDKENPAPVDNSPTTSLNGWSYAGKSSIMVNSANDAYQVFLSKCLEHTDGYMDVFYGVKYVMPNYFGLGNGVYISSTRLLLSETGETVRHIDNSDEFTSDNGFLFEPVEKTSLGETYVVDWTPCIDVEVFGTGKKEFKVYNPAFLMNKVDLLSELDKSQIHFSTGSRSPKSILSSPLCHMNGLNRLVQTGEYWNGVNIAIGTNTNTGLSFIVGYEFDSMLVKISAVAAHDNYSSDYGTIRSITPLLAKPINQIIPQWNKSLSLELIPSYFQVSSKPELLYMLFQNSESMYVVTFNMSTFKFTVENTYTQPRSTQQFARFTHSLQWIDEDEGCFLFTEKTVNGVRTLLHKNGIVTEMSLPEFKATVAKGVMDVRYDEGHYWLMVAENDKSLHIYKKSYR